ncbi:thermonuclease family protein [Candidatus Pelagibacter sp.]|nr:thermonuclease family protein [Candidatus Pelagibacter sp.]
MDAPETNFKGKKQFCLKNNEKINCGEISKASLINKIKDKKIRCLIETNKDYFGRYLGECFINSESISTYMVRSGYAFDYPKYSKKKYSKDQIYAKNNKLGLWSMQFDYPWIWRKNNR